MLYLIVALALAVFFVVHTVYGRKNTEKAQIYKKTELIIAATGAGICVLAIPLSYLIISLGKYAENYKEWANENLTLYIKDSFWLFMPIMAVLLISELLALFNPQKPTMSLIRTLLANTASVIFLLFCPIYAFTSQSSEFPLCEVILLIGIAQALLFRAPVAIELILRNRNSKKASPKRTK